MKSNNWSREVQDAVGCPKCNALKGKPCTGTNRSNEVLYDYARHYQHQSRHKDFQRLKESAGMRQSKVNAMLMNGTTVAKKIYEAVPIIEPWSIGQICAEVARLELIAKPTMSIVQGCLNSLKENKLVRETSSQHFIRTPVTSEKPEKKVNPMLTTLNLVSPRQTLQLPKAEGTEMNKNPLDLLGNLSDEAKTLSKKMMELSSKIDEVAVEIDELLNNQSEDKENLQQLRELLKKIGS